MQPGSGRAGLSAFFAGPPACKGTRGIAAHESEMTGFGGADFVFYVLNVASDFQPEYHGHETGRVLSPEGIAT